MAPKNSIAIMYEIDMVAVMSTANFWNRIRKPPKRKTPEPKVVIAPAVMLVPISA